MDNATNNSTSLAVVESINFSSPHNIWFGITGFLTNSLSVILISVSSCLRSHQKISILSLVVNDLVFMALVTVYGILPIVSHLRLVRMLCWPIVYLTLATHTVTFTTISHMAITSYLAVFKPLRFRAMTSKRKTLMTVICIWIASWLYVLVCVRFDLPIQETGCSVYLLVSSVGWIMWVCVPILCACIVTIINLKILWYLHLRKNRKVSPQETVWNCELQTLPRQGNELPAAELLPQHSAPRGSIATTCSREENVMDEPPQPRLLQTWGPRVNGDTRRGSASLLSNVHETLRLSNQADVNMPPGKISGFQRGKFSSRRNRNMSLKLLSVTESCNTVWTKEKKVGLSRSLSYAGISRSIPVSPPHILGKSNLDLKRIESTKRMQKATLTLLILTLSSCFLFLPEVVFCLILAVQPEKKEAFANSIIGKFAKLCVGISILTNPALYCWRLIQWVNLRNYVVSKWTKLRVNQVGN